MHVASEGARPVITIVNYGTSNLGSMRNMLKKVGAGCKIASVPQDLADATKIIVPGVGAFDAGMRKLQQSGMVAALNQKVLEERVPTLGVCLGMQLMTEGSEEGELPGLGWVQADARRFNQASQPDIKVPHMGWNDVTEVKPSALMVEFPPQPRFYFAHSYHVVCHKPEDVLLTFVYGAKTFTAAFQCENLLGAQFHPEKSHRFGMALLRNFVERF